MVAVVYFAKFANFILCSWTREFSISIRKGLIRKISDKRRHRWRLFKGRFLIPRDNLTRQKHWQRILLHGDISSRFLAVSFLPALPWLDEFHYVTSRVPAYKEVKDVWKYVRYCILLPRNSTQFSSELSASPATPVIDYFESMLRASTSLTFQFIPNEDPHPELVRKFM